MKALPLTELAAQVVAWHNRHPLACRIDEAQVSSMGFVVLPFVADAGTVAAASTPAPAPSVASQPSAGAGAEGASLRERAIAKARLEAAAAAAAVAAPAAPSSSHAAANASAAAAADTAASLEAAFSEDLMPGLSAAEVARWVKRHGLPTPAPAGQAPVRQVKPDPGADPGRISTRWVLTAHVDSGHQRVRLLVAPGAKPAVLGARLWSRPRLAGLAALALATIALVTLALTGAPPAAVPLAAAPLAAAPASAASSVDRPADVEASLGRVNLPSLGPRIDRRRQAQQLASGPAAPPSAAWPASPDPAKTVRALPAAAAPPTPAEAAPSAPAPTSAEASPSAPAALPAAAAVPAAAAAAAQGGAIARTGPSFALSTRLLRTRGESHQMADALRALLVTPAAPHRRVQVLPEGEDFRVVAGPYERRAEAEQLRAQLAARGLKVNVVDF